MIARRLGIAALLAGAAWLAAPVPAAWAGADALSGILPGSPLAGSALFVSRGCIACHAVLGEGGAAGPDLGRLALKRPLLELAGIMWNHSPRMESVFVEQGVRRPILDPEQMAHLLTFLYSLNQVDRPGDAAAGARLFAAKGCRGCHAVRGAGGDVGPALDKYARYASPIFLTAALWRHGPAMARSMRERGVPRPSFASDDLAHLMAFIRFAGGSGERVYARPGNPVKGEDLFTEKRCAGCHAVRGQGGKVGPDLGERGRLRGSLTRIAGAMWNHGPAMWQKMGEKGMEVPGLPTAEMSDLVSYLYFFQFVDAPGDPRRGRAVFAARRCAACHALKDAKIVGPPLAQGEALSTPLAIITAMWNHAGKMDAKMLQANMAWPTLRGTDMADLVAYILSERARLAAAERQ